jgi:hypothetical protein
VLAVVARSVRQKGDDENNKMWVSIVVKKFGQS